MRRKVTDYFLYKWRFIVGYGIIAVAFIGLLVVAGLYIPGGLSENERASTVISHSLALKDFNFTSIINLPYHLLQQASLTVFGISAFSIKLPSLLLGALTGLGMLLLLQTWFRRNIAILTSIIVTTTGQLLFVAQSGTPAIVYMFLSVWLLVAATMISRRAKYVGTWKVLLLSVAALSLYTPLSVYILVALASAVALHPHLRYIVRRVLRERVKVAIAFAAGAIVVTPLIYACIQQPELIKTLLGIPTENITVMANVQLLFQEYFNFLAPTTGALMTPIFSIGSMILIVLGVLHLLTTPYTARSYIIGAWIILLIPILIVNPRNTAVIFVPAMLLLAMGVKTLLSSWYELFPRNPYARLAGLIPLTILIGGIVLSGVDRYIYGYLYDPKTAGSFSNDLRLVKTQIASSDNVQLVVSQKHVAFYQAVADYYPNTSVGTSVIAPTNGNSVVVERGVAGNGLALGAPWRIITDGSISDGNRFYVYK